MTGFPDRSGGGPDREGGDPPEPLLRRPPGYLAAPPGTFAQIRRRAARRRRARAAGAALAAAAVLTGSVHLAGALSPRGSNDVVSPPATHSPTSAAPSTPARTSPTAPPPSPATPTARRTTGTPGGTGAATTGTGTPTRNTSPGVPAATTPMCAASQLTAALGGGDAGAGSLFRYLVLTNHGSTACHLTGYPGLSMLDAKGQQIGTPADRRPMDYTPVVLRPGQSASDTIHTVNQQGTCLSPSVKLRIYPPGNTASLEIAGSVTNCDNLFTVTPFVAGSTGNPPS